MLILNGIPNTDIRYNSYYPRWVYDQYRQYLDEAADQNGWDYLDLWNMFPPNYFTDTPLHLKPEGERQLAEALVPAIQKFCP
jgi:lysophospholipase L1-like esterase